MNATAHAAQPASQSDVSDESLIAQYRESGDRGLFETLMRRYEREIYSYLRRYIGGAEMAEDAFQGTFLQVHLKCGQFDQGRKFRPWLYTIATNQAIDHQRRNRRHRMVSLDRGGRAADDGGSLGETLVSAAVEPTMAVDAHEQQEAVRKAVAELPEQYQQLVLLIYYQGMKYREAAEVLGIPVGTVKSRLHAAITKLSNDWPHKYFPGA
jgi:RNA polymerase sigma-70 factor (ECF subfamily)